MLNEESIVNALRQTIEHLRGANLDQAEAQLEVLNFGRLQGTIEDRTKGSPIRFRDAATVAGLGTFRVNETGTHIDACLSALRRRDRTAALYAAEEALKRWQEG